MLEMDLNLNIPPLFSEYISVKLLTEHHLEFLSFKGGCTGLSESTQNATLLEITCQGSIGILQVNWVKIGKECNAKISSMIRVNAYKYFIKSAVDLK